MGEHNRKTVTALIFTLGDDRYAIDTRHVCEVRAYETPHHLPLAPPVVKGVLELRGQAAPVVDLRESFGYTDVTVRPHTMTLVLRCAQALSAVIVDSVDDVVTLDAAAIQPVPDSMKASAARSHLEGLLTLDDHLVIVVNGAQLARAIESTLPTP